MFLVTKSITCGCVLKTNSSGDITCIAGFKVFTVVSVHLKNTTHTLLITLYRIVNAGACVNSTGIYTEEANLTNKGVGSNLKCKSSKRLIVIRTSNLFLVGIGINTLNSFNVCRSGHILNNGVKQRLNTLVSVRSTAADGNHTVCDCGLTDNLLNLFGGGFFTLEVFFHQFFILLNDMLNKFSSVLISEFLHIVGDFFNSNILTKVIVVYKSMHFY